MSFSAYEASLERAFRTHFGQLSPQDLQALYQRLEWIHLLSGQVLMQQGDAPDGMYIVVAGRLVVYLGEAREKVLGTISTGESVGEMGLLTDSPRSASVKASRDSVLVKIDREQFEALGQTHPMVYRAFARTLVDRMMQVNHRSGLDLRPNLALVPITPLPELPHFIDRLYQAVAAHTETRLITQNSLSQELDLPPDQLSAAEHQPKVSRWLAEFDGEDIYGLFAAEYDWSPWTQKCVRQADEIYLLADARQFDATGETLAQLLQRRDSHPEIPLHLVLLHPHGDALPQGTHHWLDQIAPQRHHHLRLDREADLRRLARFITQQAVGLALGGGGAKGMAHLGIFKAFQELGIEVDLVGGTSIGAIMAAPVALNWSLEKMFEVSRRVFLKGRIAQDYNLPLFSLLTGRNKHRILRELFDYQIEDLWLPFFCVSCNLSNNQLKVHERGSLWQAASASSAIPGVFPPFIYDGHFLIDGAMVNNIPGDLALERGAARLINVDLNDAPEIMAERNSFPSIWELLRNRMRKRPGRDDYSGFPGLGQIFMRASLLASSNHSHQVNAAADVVLSPPVRDIGLMSWGKIDVAAEIGYREAMEYFEKHPQKLTLLQSGKKDTPSGPLDDQPLSPTA